jgi:hypothetical protein
MEILELAPRSCLETAILAADALGESEIFEGLNAPLDGAAQGILSEIWTEVRHVFRKGYELGAEKAKPFLDQAIAHVEELLERAGKAAGDIREALREKIETLVRKYIDNVLACFHPVLQFGGRELKVTSVSVSHKVLVTGDVSMSIASAFKLVASGEMMVSATYG